MAFDPKKTQTALSEINVTPLVDVMLVLLIVFMISAPLMQQGLSVDLPRTESTAITEAPEQKILVIKNTREVALDGAEMSLPQLKQRLLALGRKSKDLQILIQADQSLPYGYIAQVMSTVKAAQIHRVGLVTLPEK